MNKPVSFFLSFLIISGLASCNLPIPPRPGVNIPLDSVPYETVSAMLTDTARNQVSTPVPVSISTQTSLPEELPVTRSTLTAVPSAIATTAVRATMLGSSAEVIELKCDLAQPGRPIDVTVPDDSYFQPGESFSKTWRLVNAGSCPWTSEYAVVWFSGNDLGVITQQSINQEVPPGQPVDVTVDMVAPDVPGAYQSNWKFRNAKGDLFGIGPNGDAPFWVRIIVSAPADSTATSLPAVTQTPVTFANGRVQLGLDASADLDSGQLNQVGNDDIVFYQSADQQAYLSPMNGARFTIHRGEQLPDMAECARSGLSGEAVHLEELQSGTNLCFRTTEGLPGLMVVSSMDVEKPELIVDFVTWYVP